MWKIAHLTPAPAGLWNVYPDVEGFAVDPIVAFVTVHWVELDEAISSEKTFAVPYYAFNKGLDTDHVDQYDDVVFVGRTKKEAIKHWESQNQRPVSTE